MKTIIAMLLLGFATPVAVAADQPTLTGKWHVHNSIAGNESDMACTFTQKGPELTGTCESEQSGKVDISGKVDGTKVTWSFKTVYEGSPLTVNYDGTQEPGKISGTVAVPEYSVDGDFTATQDK